MESVLAIIPARLASSRLPRKVLLNQTGKPLIQHVVERVSLCSSIGKVVVATDAEEVKEAVEAFDGHAVMTSESCRSGSDRVAEAASHFPDATLILNVQGDEPEMSPAPLEALIKGMSANPDLPMGTVACAWPDDVALENPSVVKVVRDRRDRALYFSRSPIPFAREGSPKYLKHVGLYAYRPSFLRTFPTLEPTALERHESLEQLRALEHGHAIGVFTAEYDGIEVNTPEDYAAFVTRCNG